MCYTSCTIHVHKKKDGLLASTVVELCTRFNKEEGDCVAWLVVDRVTSCAYREKYKQILLRL